MTDDDLRAEGWVPCNDVGFSLVAGPFWERLKEDRLQYAIQITQAHLNRNEVSHGGVLLSLADQALGYTVFRETGGLKQATIQLDLQFIAPAVEGDLVIAQAEVTRVTRAVVFVRGTLEVAGRTVATASGLWKILGR